MENPNRTRERASLPISPKIHVDRYGSGDRVLVLLHGVPTAPSDFTPLAEMMSGKYRVLVPHLPGYERTAIPAGDYSLEGSIRELEDQLMAEGCAKADFLAVSGGAYRAVAIALRRRIEVRRIVLLAPVLGLEPAEAEGMRKAALAARSGRWDPRTTWLDRMASPGFPARNAKGAGQVLAWLDAAPLRLICDELIAIADAPDLRPRLAELSCPLLVCAGNEDRAVPFGMSQAVANLAPRGQFSGISGAGHALLVEEPRKTIEAIASFFAQPDPEQKSAR
jgi:pimeloyl-ACP methyl ester carboxylesterase